jgi:hypothetical protein
VNVLSSVIPDILRLNNEAEVMHVVQITLGKGHDVGA